MDRDELEREIMKMGTLIDELTVHLSAFTGEIPVRPNGIDREFLADCGIRWEE